MKYFRGFQTAIWSSKFIKNVKYNILTTAKNFIKISNGIFFAFCDGFSKYLDFSDSQIGNKNSKKLINNVLAVTEI